MMYTYQRSSNFAVIKYIQYVPLEVADTIFNNVASSWIEVLDGDKVINP